MNETQDTELKRLEDSIHKYLKSFLDQPCKLTEKRLRTVVEDYLDYYEFKKVRKVMPKERPPALGD